MLTVVTFAYGRSYTPWHAKNLRTMLEKNLTVPCRFKVVTDAVHEFTVAGFDAVKLWEVNAVLRQRNRPSGHTFARLGLFDKRIGGSLGDRLLYLPLDCIIRANVDDLIPADDIDVKVTRSVFGGPLYVIPGAVKPCPWATVQLDPEFPRRIMTGDTATGVISYMLGATASSWTEDDGIISDQAISKSKGWRVFIRTGNAHVWNHGQPEQSEYLKASGLATYTPQFGTPAAPPERKPTPQFIVRPRNKLLRNPA